MSTNDPEFYEAPKFTPEPPQALPKQRGCFFYGCLIASILAVLMLIIAGVGTYFGMRFLNRLVDDYTSTTPRELPKVEMPPEQRKAVKDRLEAFRKSIAAGDPTEPLVLTADDINALIEDDDDLKGTIHVEIEGSEVKGQVSFPLDRIPNFGMMRGRYLNGEADFKVALDDGEFQVTLDAIEVNGKRPPDEIMKSIREKNLAEDVKTDKDTSKMIRKLESLEVKDGKIILRARAKGPSATEAPAAKKDIPVDLVPPPSNGAPKAEPAKKAEPPKVDSPKAEAEPAAVEKPAPKS